MNGGKPAPVAFEPSNGNEELVLSDNSALPAPLEELDLDEDTDESRSLGWLAPTLAWIAVVAWFAGMGWLAWPAIERGMEPVALIQLIAALCVPPVLIGILYLVALRTSRAEARRFGATARKMRAEAAALERVLATISQRVAENHAVLAEHTTTLTALGERAAERVESAAGMVERQSQRMDGGIRTFGDAMDQAEKRFEIILTTLPKAHDEMQGLAGRIDSAGLLASQRAAALDTQVTALAERGREADQIAGGAAERLAAHIARMEATSETASNRLEQVTGQMSVAVDAVLDRAAGAVDEARKGIAIQGEAILAMLSANQAALDRAGRDSAEALGERIATIEEAIGRIGARLAEEQGRGDALFSGLSAGVDRLDRELQVLHAAGSDRTQSLAASISALQGSTDAMSEALRTGDQLARKVIGTSEDLLTALDASAREIDETLPEALARLDSRIVASRKIVAGAKPELLALVTAAESTHDAIEAIADVVSQQRDTLAKTQASLLETLAAGSEQAASLGAIVDDTIATTRRFAESAAPQLVDALVSVRETASAAANHAREALATIVPTAAEALEEASGEAMRRAVDASLHRQLSQLVDTTEAAVTAAARASERLTHQMVTLADTTAQIEARIEEERVDRERADSDNFARRTTLLIEALNSASIDIAKAFSAEVTDSAWAAYLKGDRGVFTRRAVRLLDSGESREIARLYDADPAFRDHVNRYIHDFEAMLRHILALRDGSTLGVTLLSSDMGKLYVALAQAIERLRT
jgi:division protein CdvB (Snf7/Vps24/ESCRT-III family)